MLSKLPLIRACVALLEVRFFFLFSFLYSCFNNNDSAVESGHEIGLPALNLLLK